MFYVAYLIIFASICFALHLYTESKARLFEYQDNFGLSSSSRHIASFIALPLVCSIFSEMLLKFWKFFSRRLAAGKFILFVCTILTDYLNLIKDNRLTVCSAVVDNCNINCLRHKTIFTKVTFVLLSFRI